MKKDSINPDFKTSRFYGMQSLTKEEILTKLRDEYFLSRTFKRYGIIDCRKYPFITKVTFSPEEKNCVEGIKNEEERLQAKQNLKIVEDYFNNLVEDSDKPLKVEFAARNDNECALYNPDRFTYDELQIKLRKIFD
ncbi:hypothetical protein [Inediibacterium massiliense]|uniref:hypothetical protein n=1 Tax=Inediibacterium massiliense TaxID=1658111 RepID=UPI0006B44940|nr:hypothetical protein [Inediibacterium massiliense]